MKNCDSHVYLYAKGHYKKTNVIEDLKIIYGKRNGIEPEFITLADIVSNLADLTFQYITVNKHSLIEFISDISPMSCWKIGAEPVELYGQKFHSHDSYALAVIKKCLSILRFTSKKSFRNELDYADPSILPLASKDKDISNIKKEASGITFQVTQHCHRLSQNKT